jgi:Na+/phosphate symporter
VIDVMDRKSLYEGAKGCRDGTELYRWCGEVARLVGIMGKDLEKAKKRLSDYEGALAEGDVTDEELVSRLRVLLLAKLSDQSLSAAEIREMKDLFGLTARTADTIIEIVSYKDVCGGCPRMEPDEPVEVGDGV